MNEELQKSVSDLIMNTIEATGEAKDFILSQMPEFIQQLLMWKIVYSLIGFISGCLLIVLAAYLVIQIKKVLALPIKNRPTWAGKYAHYEYSDDTWYSSGLFDACRMATVVITVFGIIIMGSTLAWLKIWIAPKVFLVEYAASMVK